MKITTADISGRALDYAVAIAEGWSDFDPDAEYNYVCPTFGSRNGAYDYLSLRDFSPSTDWRYGGPIIEREGIAIREIPSVSGDNGHIFTRRWIAETFRFPGGPRRSVAYGPTPLIAAMRCFVALKLDKEVEVPDELIQ